jgi:hypothetical protein
MVLLLALAALGVSKQGLSIFNYPDFISDFIPIHQDQI